MRTCGVAWCSRKRPASGAIPRVGAVHSFGAIVSSARGIEGTRSLVDPSAHAEVQARRAACQGEQSLDLVKREPR
jgi:tRNA(Arg) A34 adenosine deaminase TadA